MESFRHQPSPNSDRFLGLLTISSPPYNGSSPTDELHEDDIFAAAVEPGPLDSPKPLSPAMASSGFRGLNDRRFGILAALPGGGKRLGSSGNSLHRKAATAVAVAASAANSLSPSTSPSSGTTFTRAIPTVTKPKPDFALSLPAGKIYLQSPPVRIPIGSPKLRKEWAELDAYDDGDDAEMLPPHEIVARASANSPMTTSSVLEGMGRTLKGRDLRRVRNAIWQKTGFLN